MSPYFSHNPWVMLLGMRAVYFRCYELKKVVNYHQMWNTTMAGKSGKLGNLVPGKCLHLEWNFTHKYKEIHKKLWEIFQDWREIVEFWREILIMFPGNHTLFPAVSIILVLVLIKCIYLITLFVCRNIYYWNLNSFLVGMCFRWE